MLCISRLRTLTSALTTSAGEEAIASEPLIDVAKGCDHGERPCQIRQLICQHREKAVIMGEIDSLVRRVEEGKLGHSHIICNINFTILHQDRSLSYRHSKGIPSYFGGIHPYMGIHVTSPLRMLRTLPARYQPRL